MKKIALMVSLFLFLATNSFSAERGITIALTPADAYIGGSLYVECIDNGSWELPLKSAKLVVKMGYL